MEIRQYQIVVVNLDPTVGSEIRKTRPCVVLSPDEMNRNLHTITVCPMTTALKPYPTRIKTLLQRKVGWIVVDQIRTIDRNRIVKVAGHLKTETIVELKAIIKETFVD